MGQTLQPAQVKSGNVRDGVLGGVVSLTNSSVKCIKIPCSVELSGVNVDEQSGMAHFANSITSIAGELVGHILHIVPRALREMQIFSEGRLTRLNTTEDEAWKCR